MLGAQSPIDLLANPAGSVCCAGGTGRRDYRRYWTPVHLDFVVGDLDEAIAQARAARGSSRSRDSGAGLGTDGQYRRSVR
jgi:hypothetical protein